MCIESFERDFHTCWYCMGAPLFMYGLLKTCNFQYWRSTVVSKRTWFRNGFLKLIHHVLMELTLTCSWRNLMYSIASESTEAVSVWTRTGIYLFLLRSHKLVKNEIIYISLRFYGCNKLSFTSCTFPKGETNCCSAVILSPIFSFLA